MKDLNFITSIPFISSPQIPLYPLSCSNVPIDLNVFLKTIGRGSNSEHWSTSTKESPVLSTNSAFTRVHTLLPLALS